MRVSPAQIDKAQEGTGMNHAISALKFKIIREFLELGWNVLLSDVDVILIQAPAQGAHGALFLAHMNLSAQQRRCRLGLLLVHCVRRINMAQAGSNSTESCCLATSSFGTRGVSTLGSRGEAGSCRAQALPARNNGEPRRTGTVAAEQVACYGPGAGPLQAPVPRP